MFYYCIYMFFVLSLVIRGKCFGLYILFQSYDKVYDLELVEQMVDLYVEQVIVKKDRIKYQFNSVNLNLKNEQLEYQCYSFIKNWDNIEKLIKKDKKIIKCLEC